MIWKARGYLQRIYYVTEKEFNLLINRRSALIGVSFHGLSFSLSCQKKVLDIIKFCFSIEVFPFLRPVTLGQLSKSWQMCIEDSSSLEDAQILYSRQSNILLRIASQCLHRASQACSNTVLNETTITTKMQYNYRYFSNATWPI